MVFGLSLVLGFEKLQGQDTPQGTPLFQPFASFGIEPTPNSAIPLNPIALSNFEVEIARDAAIPIPAGERSSLIPLKQEASQYSSGSVVAGSPIFMTSNQSSSAAAEVKAATVEKEKDSEAKKESESKKEEKSDSSGKEKKSDAKKSEKKWYEKYTLRGYSQVRFNETLSRDDDSAPAQIVGDRSVGENQTFLIRRARLILQGDVSDHVSIYLQPDFASTPNGSVDNIQFAQIRDWYADCYLDTDRVNRFRVGQSKIPYGWENLQSSSNRLPLDRADALNSAARNERDLGIFYYWTPEPAQEFFETIQKKELKGSGNYGVFGFGAYNGAGGSLAEQNDDVHWISRLALPMELSNGQYAEVAMQGYTGRYSVLGSPIRPLGAGAAFTPLGTIEQGNRRGIKDERLAWTGVWYPQPLGFQTEWTVGRGPALSADQRTVEERALYGGYAMTMYRYKTRCHGVVIPFVRWSYFKGGYKTERNAPYSMINEWELGNEWQINKHLELVGMYHLTDRTNTTAINQAGVASYGQFRGDLLRFQLQFNY